MKHLMGKVTPWQSANETPKLLPKGGVIVPSLQAQAAKYRKALCEIAAYKTMHSSNSTKDLQECVQIARDALKS